MSAVTRRGVLQAFAAASVATGVGVAPRLAHAAAPADRRLLVLSIEGGFVPTTFDPKFAADGRTPAPGTDPDPGTVRRSHGGLAWSGGPTRPAMDRYFARWSSETALVRGLWSHRLDHAGSAQAILAGTADQRAPEVLARVADALGGRFRVYGSSPWPVGSGEASPDRHDAAQADAAALGLRARCAAADLRAGAVVAARVEVPGGWDDHDRVETADADLEVLFTVLDDLLGELARTPGRTAPSQLDEVTVAVVGDVGRSVRRNYRGGRDHGRTHAVLLAGAGVRGGRTYGHTDATGAAVGWDPATGAASDGVDPVPTASLAVGLLAHMGLEAPPLLRDTPALRAFSGLPIG